MKVCNFLLILVLLLLSILSTPAQAVVGNRSIAIELKVEAHKLQSQLNNNRKSWSELLEGFNISGINPTILNSSDNPVDKTFTFSCTSGNCNVGIPNERNLDYGVFAYKINSSCLGISFNANTVSKVFRINRPQCNAMELIK